MSDNPTKPPKPLPKIRPAIDFAYKPPPLPREEPPSLPPPPNPKRASSPELLGVRVDALDGRIDATENRIDDIRSALDKVDRNVTDVGVRLATLAETVDELKTKEGSRKALWSFLTVIATAAAGVVTNYATQDRPTAPAVPELPKASLYDRSMAECRALPTSAERVECIDRVDENNRYNPR